MNAKHYPNLLLRFLLAFGATIFLLFRGKPFDPETTFFNPRFWFAFFVSLGIALIMVSAVHHVAKWVNGIESLKPSFPVKSMVQLAIGIVAPAAIDLVLISLFFLYYDENIVTNGFLWIDFPFILLMLFLLNMFYLLYEVIAKLIMGASILPPFIPENERIPIKSGDKDKAPLLQNVICFYRLEKKIYAATMDEEIHECIGTIESLAQRYIDYSFVRTTRAIILNLRVIDSYRYGKKRDTLELEISSQYYGGVPVPKVDLCCVTRDYRNNFKNRFAVHKKNL